MGAQLRRALKYATPGFFAFGVFSYPAGWLADKWSREGMMVVFFVGIGLASVATGFAQTPLQVGIGLFVIGMFAAIYHPVGLAMVTQKWKNTGMRLAVNGVWGNLGVASAALITGYLIDNGGWRMAFIMPGVVSVAVGLAYCVARRDEIFSRAAAAKSAAGGVTPAARPQGAAAARVADRVHDHGDFQHHLPGDDLRAAEDLRRAAARASPRRRPAWLQGHGLGGRADVATMVGAFAFIGVRGRLDGAAGGRQPARSLRCASGVHGRGGGPARVLRR